MKLYHGSNKLISHIDLAQSKDFKDFGRGFYLTRDYRRAVFMAQRTTAIEATGSPEVSPYLFYPNRCPSDLRICEFKSRTADWALFVLENRYKDGPATFRHDYDIVIGPVADSRVDSLLSAYRKKYGKDYKKRENLIKLAEQIKYPVAEYIQYCFCTTKGIEQLIYDL